MVEVVSQGQLLSFSESLCMLLLSITTADEMLTSIVIMLLTVLLIGLIVKKFNQPYFVAYIVAGIVLGPYVGKLFQKAETTSAIGELGLLIQMFFIGAKMEVQAFTSTFKKPFVAVLAQLVFGFLFMLIVGHFYLWDFKKIFLYTFVISLSSSAIILDYLEKSKEIDKPLGSITSAVLIFQDFMLVPILLIINFMGNKELSIYKIVSLPISAIFITLLLREVVLKRKIKLPLPANIQSDPDLQVFTSLLLCFGFAWLSQLINLSAATGALIGGILIAQSNSMSWLEAHLAPFRIFFLSLFFFSVGLQINLPFMMEHSTLILFVVAIVFVINSTINALIFRLLQVGWRDSVYAGALLSQIGEFSLVLCIVAKNQQLVNEFSYQLTLAVISSTMLFTAIWIKIIRSMIFKNLNIAA